MSNNDFNSIVINSLNRIENSIDHLKEQLDVIDKDKISKNDCKKNQELCIKNFDLKKKEITPKLITAIIGGAIILNQIIDKIAAIFKSS